MPKADNDLVILDSDSRLFTEAVVEELADTFQVKTGSGNAHFYYRSDYSGNQSFKTGSDEFGSIRSENWHAVGPNSVHPETGNEYVVSADRDLAWIAAREIRQFCRVVEAKISEYDREDGGGGPAAAAPPSSRRKASDLQNQPTDRTLDILRFINSDEKRRQIAKVLDHDHPPRNIRVWAGGFLHSAVGLTQNQIERLLRETASWATDDGRIRVEVRSLVQSSIENSRANESVDLDRFLTGDMGSTTPESRKTEESGKGRTLQGGESDMTDMNYTSIDSLTAYNAGSPDQAEDGDRIVRVELTNMTGSDENGDVDTDFVTVQKGSLRDNGEFGVSPEFNGDSKSVGAANPDDLRLIAEGLEKMADRIEESD